MKNPPILKAMFGEDTASSIGRTFEFMEIAEKEIAKAKKRVRNEEVAKRIHEVFGAAFPGQLLKYSDTVYRAHVRELCARAKANEDMRPATKAEVMVALCEGSLLAPLDQQHTALYEELFHAVFGAYVGPSSEVTKEPYQHASVASSSHVRNKFRNERRINNHKEES